MYSRVPAKFGGKETLLAEFESSEFIMVDGKPIQDFALSGSKKQTVHDRIGSGKQTTLVGVSGLLRKTVVATVYDQFPQMAFFSVRYTDQGTAELNITGWTNHRHSINAQEGARERAFWSYQSGSYQKRPDWVLPLKLNFQQENYLGMNATDYGGGTPVVASASRTASAYGRARYGDRQSARTRSQNAGRTRWRQRWPFRTATGLRCRLAWRPRICRSQNNRGRGWRPRPRLAARPNCPTCGAGPLLTRPMIPCVKPWPLSA